MRYSTLPSQCTVPFLASGLLRLGKGPLRARAATLVVGGAQTLVRVLSISASVLMVGGLQCFLAAAPGSVFGERARARARARARERERERESERGKDRDRDRYRDRERAHESVKEIWCARLCSLFSQARKSG